MPECKTLYVGAIATRFRFAEERSGSRRTRGEFPLIEIEELRHDRVTHVTCIHRQ